MNPPIIENTRHVVTLRGALYDIPDFGNFPWRADEYNRMVSQLHSILDGADEFNMANQRLAVIWAGLSDTQKESILVAYMCWSLSR